MWNRNAGRWEGAKKREVVAFNMSEDVNIQTVDRSVLTVKDDFKCLGSYVSSIEDIKIQKEQDWQALYRQI